MKNRVSFPDLSIANVFMDEDVTISREEIYIFTNAFTSVLLLVARAVTPNA